MRSIANDNLGSRSDLSGQVNYRINPMFLDAMLHILVRRCPVFASAICQKQAVHRQKQANECMSVYVELGVAKSAHAVIPPLPQLQKKHRF